jgi:hypothetical protein
MKPLPMQPNTTTDATKIYYLRMLTMMADYSSTLQEAIQWDYDGFMPFPYEMILSPEEEYDYYLHCNYLPDDNRKMFVDMALGKIPTYGLRRDKTQTKQKDAGSTDQA